MEERERSLSDEKNGPLSDGYDTQESTGSHEITKATSHKKDGPLPELTKSTRNGSATQDDDDPLPLSSQPAIQPATYPLPLSSQPAIQPATYVVQVPKDQIYRIPPPEHAFMLTERHANQKKQKGSCCLSGQACCSFFLLGRWRRKESAPTRKPDSDV